MKKLFLTLFLIISSNFVFSQTELAPNKYLIRFTDKNNSDYSINRPEEFLSQRAINRRLKQNINISKNDVPVNSEYINEVKNTGVSILNTSKWFNSISIETTDIDSLRKIMAFPFVKNDVYKPITISKKQGKSFFENEQYYNISTEPFYKSTFGDKYNYGIANNQIEMINGKDLHNKDYRGQGIIIGVIDAGFLNANNLEVFDSLWINNQILGEYNFVEKDASVFNSHYHGSMVLSTMGGNIPGEYIGTAPKANYLLLKSEDTNSEYLIEEYNWASAAEFADSVGVDVINSSLGYTFFDAQWQNHTYSDMDGNTVPISIAADIAASKGIIVVNSAGNEGDQILRYISAPGDSDSVLCVGAVDSEGFYASFSSIGPSYDGRIKPNIVAQGERAAIFNPFDGFLYYGNGTSFSSPIIAGMCACLWQAHPNIPNMEIVSAIIKSADRSRSPDDYYGYGIPDFVAADSSLYEIENKMDEDFSIKIFPNPFVDQTNIIIYSTKSQNATLEVYDISGRRIGSYEKIELNSGFNKKQFKALNNISKGIYFIKISTENNIIVEKVVKYRSNGI